jgi:hypothetical protein
MRDHMHVHQVSGSLVIGTQIKPGTELNENDLYASRETYTWTLCPYPGVILEEGCTTIWVRPDKIVAEGDKIKDGNRGGVVESIDREEKADKRVCVRYDDGTLGTIARSRFTVNWNRYENEWWFD